MLVSQKSRYALRAVFHLALHHGQGPIKIADIAKAEAIPPRFLEVILPQIKQGRFVASQRGNVGGYYLTRDPQELTVGELLRFLEGPLAPPPEPEEPLNGGDPNAHHDVFAPLWEKLSQAINEVYDSMSFQDLVNRHREDQKHYVPTWSI